jgi:glycine/D-amino acid oxidase-like deaminating enzyme
MPIELDRFSADKTMPSSSDVVVIGGGIIGASTALFLAERGLKTVLCEKGQISGEQSGRNWGWCRSMGRDPRELPLMLESLRLWRGMNARLGAETGFRQCGTLYLCPDEVWLSKREAWLPYAKEHQLESCILRGEEVNRVLVGSVGRWLGALYTPNDGVAEPAKATVAIARGAQQAGATVMTNCAVRTIETSAGRVSGVVTEKGPIACRSVVLSAGAWSSLFCKNLGIRLPQLKVLASVLRTAPVVGGPSVAAWGPGLALRKRLDGGYTVSHGSVVANIVPDSFRYFMDFLPVLRAERKGISLRLSAQFLQEMQFGRGWTSNDVSPFEKVRTLEPDPVADDLANARTNLERAFPVFKGVPTLASWAGFIDATPDLLPVISTVPKMPGLVVSTGYSGHGFGIGPAAGRLTADLAAENLPIVDPSPFRLSRFDERPRPTARAGL